MSDADRRDAIACELRAVDLADALAAAVNGAPHWRSNAQELLRQIRQWEPPPPARAPEKPQLSGSLSRSPSLADERHVAAWHQKRELHR